MPRSTLEQGRWQATSWGSTFHDFSIASNHRILMSKCFSFQKCSRQNTKKTWKTHSEKNWKTGFSNFSMLLFGYGNGWLFPQIWYQKMPKNRDPTPHLWPETASEPARCRFPQRWHPNKPIGWAWRPDNGRGDPWSSDKRSILGKGLFRNQQNH